MSPVHLAYDGTGGVAVHWHDHGQDCTDRCAAWSHVTVGPGDRLTLHR